MNSSRAITRTAVIFSLFGLLSLVGGMFFAYRQYTFSQTAKTTTGTVVDVKKSVTNRVGKPDKISYTPYVTFEDATGTLVEFKAASSNPPGYSMGQIVPVLFDPNAPEKAYINNFSQRWLPAVLMAGFGLFFGSIGGGIFLYRYRRRKKIEWLRDNGHRIPATFVSCELQRNYRVNGRSPYIIIARGKNPFTQIDTEFKSDSLWIDPSPYLAPYKDQGDSLEVLIDPTHPESYWLNTDFISVTDHN